MWLHDNTTTWITRQLHQEKTTRNDIGEVDITERWRHPTLHHVPVGIISDGVDMRGDLVSFLPFVHVNDLF